MFWIVFRYVKQSTVTFSELLYLVLYVQDFLFHQMFGEDRYSLTHRKQAMGIL